MTTFSLTSFNARWGLTVDDQPFALHEAVASFDSDVVAVQEVWEPADGSGALEPTADALGYRVLHAPLSGSTVDPRPAITALPHEVRGTWGVALLTRLPVLAVRTVDLGRLVERWDVATRHAILADLEVAPGRVVTVAAAHLSFALPNAVAQLRRLHGYLPTHRPSVVAGDCNLWGPLASATLGGRRRAVRGRTWPAHRPHSQLDHILVSDDLEVVEGTVLPAAGSDHLPVRAVLRLPEPPHDRGPTAPA